jgi:hypothetical protein
MRLLKRTARSHKILLHRNPMEHPLYRFHHFRILATDLNTGITTYERVRLIVNECVNGVPVANNPTILSSAVQVSFCVCNDATTGALESLARPITSLSSLPLGEYCERSVTCTDMTACRLNFLSNVTCVANLSLFTTNAGQAPYQCLNGLTNRPCSNASECCQRGYEFHSDVQQCLCKLR